MLPNILPDINTPARDLAHRPTLPLLELETVFEALARLRTDPARERMVHFYVTDSDGRLVGVAPVRRLLLAEPSTLVGELMVQPVFAVRESEAFGSALPVFAEHRLLALPVVDNQGRLTGVLDVSAATRALFEMERRESDTRVFQTIGIRAGRQRAGVLSGLAVAFLLAFLIAAFEGVWKRTGAVVFFIPAVLATAAAAGRRAVTMSVDSLGLTRRGEIQLRDLSTSLGPAVAGAAIAGLAVTVWLGKPAVALTVACSLAVAAVVGALFGYAIPRLVHGWRLDPRIASGPLVMALAEVVALSCYLVASALFI